MFFFDTQNDIILILFTVSFHQISEFDLVQGLHLLLMNNYLRLLASRHTPVIDEQLLEAIGLTTKSSMLRAHLVIGKDIVIARSLTSPHMVRGSASR